MIPLSGLCRRKYRQRDTISCQENRYTNGEEREYPGNLIDVEQDAALHIALHGFHCPGKTCSVLSGKPCDL